MSYVKTFDAQGRPRTVEISFTNYPTEVAWEFIAKKRKEVFQTLCHQVINLIMDDVVAALKCEFITERPLRCTDFEEYLFESMLVAINWTEVAAELIALAREHQCLAGDQCLNYYLELPKHVIGPGWHDDCWASHLADHEAAEPKMCGCDEHNSEEPHR